MDSRSARIADCVPWIATYVERLEIIVSPWWAFGSSI